MNRFHPGARVHLMVNERGIWTDDFDIDIDIDIDIE